MVRERWGSAPHKGVKADRESEVHRAEGVVYLGDWSVLDLPTDSVILDTPGVARLPPRLRIPVLLYCHIASKDAFCQ